MKNVILEELGSRLGVLSLNKNTQWTQRKAGKQFVEFKEKSQGRQVTNLGSCLEEESRSEDEKTMPFGSSLGSWKQQAAIWKEGEPLRKSKEAQRVKINHP